MLVGWTVVSVSATIQPLNIRPREGDTGKKGGVFRTGNWMV